MTNFTAFLAFSATLTWTTFLFRIYAIEIPPNGGFQMVLHFLHASPSGLSPPDSVFFNNNRAGITYPPPPQGASRTRGKLSVF